MSTASLAERERTELCDLMLEVGPQAATLDEGWAVLDLAAHLVAREHDIWAAGGIVIKPLAFLMDQAMDRRRRQGLAKLVGIIRKGEPVWYRLVPRGGQLTEYYIHHEDVRRANGFGPRTDRPDLDQKLGRLVRASAKFMLRRTKTGVELRWLDEVLYTHRDEPLAVVSGPPGEILLFLSGRDDAARVEIAGDAAAVAALADAPLGM